VRDERGVKAVFDRMVKSENIFLSCIFLFPWFAKKNASIER